MFTFAIVKTLIIHRFVVPSVVVVSGSPVVVAGSVVVSIGVVVASVTTTTLSFK